MNLPVLNLIIVIVIPIICGMVAYIVRNMIARIEALETKMERTVSEGGVRQILADKLDPIHDDLTEIKDSIKKLFDLYLEDNKNGSR